MRFSAEQAFEASESGEPIMISLWAAERIVKQHDCDTDGFDELFKHADAIDAAKLMEWLGY